MWRNLFIAVALSSGLLAGCKPAGDAPRRQNETKPEAFSITEILIQPATSAEGVMRPQTVDAPIVVLIRNTGSAGERQLQAKLIDIGQGKPVGARTLTYTARTPSENTLTFKPRPAWGEGRHLLEVTLDGKLVASRDIDVFSVADAESMGAAR
ncbi:hypothetical protein EBB59_11475 [Lysobacter pythonis]|uniref:Uncharacterized protein n=1 Tax=Solilutibacter pythonis TaxID=2483112 RepID=A0A3M2HP48_9GAMM|nr:hypothetical protein EBB59_11475 [Lysobacter pythonis]